MIDWFNKQIKKYVLSNQKLSQDVLAGINDKRARQRTKELEEADKAAFKRNKNGEFHNNLTL